MITNEAKLIFIISQPRAGSTLTQKLLSNNSHVDTVSEPWILLPLLSIYKPQLIVAKYNYEVALQGFLDFLKKRNRELEFKEELKSLILHLYRAVDGNAYFIDKTPRYYEILPEMIDLFGRARFIVLKRNPFASLYSMLATWSRGRLDFERMKGFYRDFLVAPFLIQDFCDRFGSRPNVLEVAYESIISDPVRVVKSIYDWLGIPFSSDVLKIDQNEKVKGIFGDDVYGRSPSGRISEEKADTWKQAVLASPELTQFFSEYQSYLSVDFLNRYGYEQTNFKLPRFRWRKSKFADFVSLIGGESELTCGK